MFSLFLPSGMCVTISSIAQVHPCNGDAIGTPGKRPSSGSQFHKHALDSGYSDPTFLSTSGTLGLSSQTWWSSLSHKKETGDMWLEVRVKATVGRTPRRDNADRAWGSQRNVCSTPAKLKATARERSLERKGRDVTPLAASASLEPEVHMWKRLTSWPGLLPSGLSAIFRRWNVVRVHNTDSATKNKLSKPYPNISFSII